MGASPQTLFRLRRVRRELRRNLAPADLPRLALCGLPRQEPPGNSLANQLALTQATCVHERAGRGTLTGRHRR